MRPSPRNLALKNAVLALSILLLAAGASFAQSTVTLRAQRQTTTLPDGNTIPMWGWTCGTGPAPGNGDAAPSAATCSATNGSGQGTTWQPPLILVPTGNTLSITLNNSLPVETSLTIVGLVGTGSATNGVGNPVRELTPRDHPTQTETTWILNGGATFTPPAQGLRARSFAQEASANGGTVIYSWSALKPGTYLIESGTYPSIQGPMGLTESWS